MSYRTPVSECAPAEVSAALSGADRFTLLPKAKISFGKPGEKAKLHVRPGFDAASQAAHAGIGADPAPAATAAAPAAAQTADGKPAPPEKGFFAKYWMYIVPVSGGETKGLSDTRRGGCLRLESSVVRLCARAHHSALLCSALFCVCVRARVLCVQLGIFMVMQAVVAPPEQPSGGGGAGGGGAARAQ